MKLRAYEQDWIKRIKASKQRRILVVGPTGSGKTIIAADLIRSAVKQGGSVLFIVHRRELLRQAVQRLFDHGVPWEDIGAIIGGTHAKEDEETFAENPGALVQVASIQTLVRRKRPKATYVFVDEAHHAAAATYQKVLKHYPSAKIIGLTATPYRLDGKPLGDMFDVIIESAKPSKLIEQGWISRPKVWTVPPKERPNLKEVKRAGADLNQGELEKVTNRKQLVGSIVKHWKKHAEGRSTVCYAVSIAHAEAIASAFKRARIKASVISSNTPNEERSSLLEKLKTGEVQVLVNCMVLTEGWDCPEAKCAIVARSTLSQSLWFQMGGRIMRPGDKCPIILDHAGNALWMPCPGDDIEHSLTGAQKLKTGHREPKEKTCPECGNQLFLGTRVCTECGHEFWIGEPPEEIAGQLEDVQLFENRICEEYAKSKSLTKVAIRCSTSIARVLSIVRRYGIWKRGIWKKRLRKKLPKLDPSWFEEALRMYSNRFPIKKIAKELKKNSGTVRGMLKRKGVYRHPDMDPLVIERISQANRLEHERRKRVSVKREQDRLKSEAIRIEKLDDRKKKAFEKVDRISESVQLEICADYESGISLNSIRKKFHLAERYTAIEVLNRHQVHVRTKSESTKIGMKICLADQS